ncbi:von Willebrand factor A domain-containing protein 5A [Folsomia candida]|nr:von Willebrand factor A domain-containing protein 5A [Folsomia candida]
MDHVEISESFSSSTEDEDMEEDDDDEEGSSCGSLEIESQDEMFIKSFQNVVESGLIYGGPPLGRNNINGKCKKRVNEIIETYEENKRRNASDDERSLLHRLPVPLKSVKIEAALVHVVAQVQVTQIYRNEENFPIQVVYFFPVDSNGAVTHFQAEIEGRVVKGIVKAKGKEENTQCSSTKDDEIDLVGEEETPDIFKVSIGRLKPGQEVKVVVGYVTEAKNDADTHTVRFFLPTAITPRCLPTAKIPCCNSFSQRSKGSIIMPELQMTEESVAPLSIKVIASMQGKIKSVESPSHKIVVEHKGEILQKPMWYKSIATLEGLTTEMDRDFVLFIKPEESIKARLYAETLPNGSSAVMSYFVPSFKLDEQKMELIIVVDRSESMSGRNIEIVKKVLKLLLQSLPADCYFNVVGFGNHHHFMFKGGSKRCNDQTLKDAINYANKIQSDMGGTELVAPLQNIYNESMISGYFRQVLIISDGAVCDANTIIGLVRMNAHIGRTLTLGVGSAPSHHLLEGIAKAGNGTCAFIDSDANIHKQTLAQLKNALQPSLTNIKIEWEGVQQPIFQEKTLDGYNKNINSQNTLTSHDKISPIFDGTQVLIFGVFEAEKPLGAKIMADSPDGTLTLGMKLSAENDLGATKMLHRLAVIKSVRELELEECVTQFLSRPRREPELTRIKEAILRVAIADGISSKYTSFTSPDGKSSNYEDNMCNRMHKVPLQYPFAYSVMKDGRDNQKCCAKIGMRQERPKLLLAHGSAQHFPLNGTSKRPRKTSASTGKVGKIKRKPSPLKKVRRERNTIHTDIEPMDTTTMEDVNVYGLDLLQRIISCQNSEGYFSLNPVFASLISLELALLKQDAESNEWDARAWATTLAIIFFKTKLAPFESIWECVAIKSQKWILQNQLNSTDAMNSRAEELLK